MLVQVYIEFWLYLNSSRKMLKLRYGFHKIDLNFKNFPFQNDEQEDFNRMLFFQLNRVFLPLLNDIQIHHLVCTKLKLHTLFLCPQNWLVVFDQVKS